jgi:beta-N-acetylhexosaminidase
VLVVLAFFAFNRSAPVEAEPVAQKEKEVAIVVKDEISLQDKIDQLFIIGFRGSSLEKAPELKKALSETNLGGVVLFDYDTPTKKYNRNILSSSQLTTLIKEIKSNSKTPIFISVDEEGGKVSRLKKISGFKVTPSAETLGSYSDVKVTSIASDLAVKLTSFGFNMDFAPVLDVNVNKKSPAIGAFGRSFSPLQSVVSAKAIAFMDGLKDQNIISVGKHYPGHGSAVSDTHKGLADITKTYKEYESVPFEKACEASIPSIMIGHLFNANVDKTFPATMSKAHIDKLKSLGCDTQVLITDDIDMKALSAQYSRHDVLVRSINAGIDIVIASNNISTYKPNQYFTDRKIVFDAVEKGEISQSRIDEAYEKVTNLKAEFGIIK